MTRKTKRTQKGWTSDQRAAARARILANKPWEKSTGPKTEAGKQRAAMNAYKGTIDRVLMAEYMLALKYHKKFMEQIRNASTIHLEREWLRQQLAKRKKAGTKNQQNELSLGEKI